MTKKIKGYKAEIDFLRIFVELDQEGLWSIGIFNTSTKQLEDDNLPQDGNTEECAKREAAERVAYRLEKPPDEIKLDWMPTDSSPH